MKRSVGSAVVALAATAALIGGGVSSMSASAQNSGHRTLHFNVHFSPFFLLDLGQPGPSMGDEIVSRDVLVDRAGNRVGHDGLSCVITDAGGPEADCTGTFVLPGGQISVQFLNSPPPVKHMAVTGGTGRFHNVRGEAVLVENAQTPTGTVRFNLIG